MFQRSKRRRLNSRPRRTHTNEQRGRAYRVALEALESRLALTGTWSAVAQAPANIGTMMLLSDGTVMASASTRGSFADVNYHNASKSWYKLTPDASGSYVNGTWSQMADMNTERLYFPAKVLPDGRVFVLGGKYDGPNGFIDDPGYNTGEIYDPVTNTWSSIPNILVSNRGSGPSMLLPDGKVLVATPTLPQTYIYDPATNTWSTGPNKLDNDPSHRETLTKLPDGSGLLYNIHPNDNPGHTQRYDPATNSWLDSGTPPVALLDPAFFATNNEILGPAILLPDGRVFQIGNYNGNTALYTPSAVPGGTGTWAAGPVIAGGSGYGAEAMLPNGHVLYVGGKGGPGPNATFTDHVVEFDPTAPIATSITDVASPTPDLSTWNSYKQQLLVLPSGQVLFSYEHNQLYVYTPDGAPQAAWKPTITSVAASGDHYTLTGTQLNGLDAGASYNGDGAAEMDSNYPIVELKATDGSGKVYFARTSNWSSTGVQTGTATVSTDFSIPAYMPYGTYSLTVIANGIASDPVDFIGGFAGTSADLAVTYTTPSRVIEGSNLTYNLTVKNNGPTDAMGVVLSDTFGANWKYLSATTGQGTFTRSGNVVTFSMGSIPAGQTATATVTVQSLEDGQFTNTATVTGSVFDADPIDNSVASTITVYEAPISVSGPISMNGKKAVNNQTVATFTHANGVEPASAFVATIDWGDGTPTSVGSISLSGTTYTVKGSHSFASGGTHTVTTTVVESSSGGGSMSALAVMSSSSSNTPTSDIVPTVQSQTTPPGIALRALKTASVDEAFGTTTFNRSRRALRAVANDTALDDLFASV